MQHVNELTEPPIVGRYYRVPCVFVCRELWASGEPKTRRTWLPIFGPKHEDATLGFAPEHWHIDYRFFSSDNESAWGVYNSGQVIEAEFDRDMAGPLDKRRMCIRKLPDKWPFNREPPPRKIEREVARLCAGKKLCKGICPHRGANLSSISPDAFGVITCPAHGLQFNAKTGTILTVPSPTKLSGRLLDGRVHDEMPEVRG